MSGVVRLEIRKTIEELITLMRKKKDVLRHEKLQVLYWLKTKTVDSVLSASVRRTGNIVPQSKDGCLVIEKGEYKNYYCRNLVRKDQE
jgi:putative heme iron utilization protein